MGNYAVAADVRNHKVNGIVVDLCNYTDTEINTEISFVEEFIENITNNIFYPKTQTILLDGNGFLRIFFFPTVPWKLVTLTSVKELRVDQTTVIKTLIENLDITRYDHYLEFSRAVAARKFLKVWRRGTKNFEIVGVWGNATVVPAIKKVTILLTLENLITGSSGLTRFGIEEARWNDFGVKFLSNRSSDNSVGKTTGFQELDRILDRYINVVDMFLVIPDTKQTFDTVKTSQLSDLT